MKTRKHNYNCRLIKATWPYTAQEAAEQLGVHKGVVLRWLKEGLQADTSQRPFLIHGSELIRFINIRKHRRKHTCGSNQFFCLKCRVPRTSYLNIVDIVIQSSSRFKLKGICAECGTTLNKMQSIKKLQEIQSIFVVQQLEGTHMIERDAPNLNSDLEMQI